MPTHYFRENDDPSAMRTFGRQMDRSEQKRGAPYITESEASELADTLVCYEYFSGRDKYMVDGQFDTPRWRYSEQDWIALLRCEADLREFFWQFASNEEIINSQMVEDADGLGETHFHTDMHVVLEWADIIVADYYDYYQ